MAMNAAERTNGTSLELGIFWPGTAFVLIPSFGCRDLLASCFACTAFRTTFATCK